jgi:serine protease Do
MNWRRSVIIYLLIGAVGIIVGILFQLKPAETFIEKIVDSRLQLLNPREFVAASQKIKPSVVGVVVTKLKKVNQVNPYSHFFQDYLRSGRNMAPRYKTVQNMGSGILVDTLGHIVTSNHIVAGAEELSVSLSDGRSYIASLLGGDSLSDLAVIKLDGDLSNITPAKFVQYDSLAVGEFVLAVGNPFLNFFNSADPTITQGIVSALHRNFRFSGNGIYQDMIQTDAAINPGNSGGPLINSAGEVVGVNSFIYTGNSEVQGSVGIGFAIPGRRSYHIASELINHGRRRIAWTGLNIAEEEGVVITNVSEGGPGAQAGIQVGDQIVRIGNRRIRKAADIIGVFLPYFPGDSLEIAYLRNGVERVVTLVLVEVPHK